jgi:uncharacterized protein involved in type VI secretion and phage assembly
MEHVSGGAVPGVVPGLVVDLDDPKRLGRVKVTFPDLGNVPSDWCRIVTPSAGGGRGLMFRPEKGEEVMVCFERGDPRAPYVLGGVWNQTDKPPTDPDPVANDLRSITSRSGHVIRLTDTDGQERIEIIDASTSNSLVINTKDNSIEIKAAGDVTIEAGGKLTLKAQAQLVIKGQTVDIN